MLPIIPKLNRFLGDQTNDSFLETYGFTSPNEMYSWVRANAKRERIKAILSHKLDRVCRNMRDAVRLQELEDLCGVQLAFVDWRIVGVTGVRLNRCSRAISTLP
jgi:hypothetical protein